MALLRLLAMLAAFFLPAAALADGLVDNINGISVDGVGNVSRFAAFTVTKDGRFGRILRAGETPAERPDWRVDGAGRTVIPGLIDAHGHVMSLGIAALTLDLSGTNSLAEAQGRIAAFAAAHPDRHWIIGRGWNQERWKLGRFPTAAELNAVVADRPVWLERADGHAGWANSAAMLAARVTPLTKAPAGGRIEMAAGKPSGVFVDAAQELVARVVPEPLAKERDLAFVKAQEALFAFGITATADMGTSQDDWNAYRRAGDEGRLLIRIFSYSAGLEPMAHITGGGPTPWLYDDRLRMAGVKLYADGALGSRGACLKAPYSDAPGQSGLCFLDDAKLRNQMSRAAMDGFQVAVHAIGDRANTQVLDAIDDMVPTYKGDRRWRIEHAQIVDPADLPRFGKNGIIASMQPVHQTSDRLMAEARLGPNRLGGAYAWATMLRNGAHLAFGSDYPVESPNPFPGMAAALSREDANGEPAGGWQPQERITREQALAAFTTGAAYASFAEDRLGKIAPGYRADFLILDRDPLMSSPHDLAGIKVLETWVGGRRVYRRSAPTAAPVSSGH